MFLIMENLKNQPLDNLLRKVYLLCINLVKLISASEMNRPTIVMLILNLAMMKTVRPTVEQLQGFWDSKTKVTLTEKTF